MTTNTAVSGKQAADIAVDDPRPEHHAQLVNGTPEGRASTTPSVAIVSLKTPLTKESVEQGDRRKVGSALIIKRKGAVYAGHDLREMLPIALMGGTSVYSGLDGKLK